MPSASTPSPPAGARLREIKRALRLRTLAARDALTPDVRASASQAIADRIAQLPAFAVARTVLLTLPYRSEWDTTLLVGVALAAGKTVAVPRVEIASRMLALHAIGDPVRDVVRGHRGLPEPKPTCPSVAPAAIDFVLVPGVAFDPAGRRLGYGGGYYDRLLPLIAQAVPRIAGAFDVQIVATVPAAPHDLAVDAVVTETRAIVRG